MIGIIALPVVLGTAAVILVNWPMPEAFVYARVAEASFWLFAAMGALFGQKTFPERRELGLRWADGAVILLTVLTVRAMVRGIRFVP